MIKLDRVRLEGLEVNCIVGLLPHERSQRQPLELTVDLYFDSREAGSGGGLAASVDYARLCGEVRFLLEACRFVLLEEAAEALARYALTEPTVDCPRAPIVEVEINLRKPKALGGLAVPSLRVYRSRRDLHYQVERKSFGAVDVVYEADRSGIYRLRLDPGGVIPLHHHQQMEEHELILGSGLHLQNQPVEAGTGRRWPKGFAHTYENPSDTEQTILCVDRPSFLPDDEIETKGPVGDLRTVQAEHFYPASYDRSC